MRTCPKCGKFLPDSEFRRKKNGKSVRECEACEYLLKHEHALARRAAREQEIREMAAAINRRYALDN